MSDQSQGPGWWEASDDKWYPPELHPDFRAPGPSASPAPAGPTPPAEPPPPHDRAIDSGPIPVPARRPPAASGQPTRAQQTRWMPWYRQPWAIAGGVVAVLLLAFLVVRGGGGGDGGTGTELGAGSDGSASGSDSASDSDLEADGRVDRSADETDSASPGATLYPERPDRAEQDLEREVGDGARLAGYSTTVESTRFEASISELENVGYLVVHVRVANRRDDTQPFNIFDWQLVRGDGSVVDPALTTRKNIGSGELDAGEAKEGDVIFEIGGERGDFYVVYKPDLFDAARGIWKVTLD